MGFFAVLTSPDELAADYKIKRCHLSLWCLAGLFRRAYFWDVGLEIQVGDNQFSNFQLALPSGTTDRIHDIIEKVRDQKTAQMIFGKPVTISAAGVLKYDENELSLTSLGPATLQKDESG